MKRILTILFILFATNVYGQGLDANTVLLMSGDNDHETGASTKDGSLEIMDLSGGHIITQVGDATLSTTEVKYGSSALALDGTGDDVTAPDSADWQFQNSDFTIQGWINFSSFSADTYVFSQREDGSNLWYVYFNNFAKRLQINVTTGGTVRGVAHSADNSFDVSTGTWFHFAMVKSGSTTYMFKDGVSLSVTQDTAWGTAGDVSAVLEIGGHNGATNAVNGYLDDIEIADTARYTANFTPAELEPDANSLIYLDMNSQDRSGDGGSGTYHVPTFEGDAQVDTAVQELGSGSYLYDGTGDYIAIPDSALFDIGTNLTIDKWVKHADHAGTETYTVQYVDATNYWVFEHIDGTGLHFQVDGGGADIDISGGEITDTNFHHVAVIKDGSAVGIYKDGTKVASGTAACTTSFAAALNLGGRTTTNPFSGNMDEDRLQASNYFAVDPSGSGTFTPPTEAYSVDAGRNRQIFISKFIKKDTGEYDRCKDIRSEEDCMEIHHYIHNGA